MSEGTPIIRLSKAASEFNVGVLTIIEYLHKKGFKIDSNPNTKLSEEMYLLLVKEYQPDKAAKEISKKKELEFPGHSTLTIDSQIHTGNVKEEKETPEIFIKSSNLQSKLTPEKPAAVPVQKAPTPPPAAPVAPVAPAPVPPVNVVPPVITAPPVAEAPPVIVEPPVPVAPPEPQAPPEPKPEVPEPTVEKEEPVPGTPPAEPVVDKPKEPVVVKHEETPEPEPAKAETEAEITQTGPVVLGKIDLSQFESKKQEKKKKKGGKEEAAPKAKPIEENQAEAEPVAEAVKEEIAEEVVPQETVTPVETESAPTESVSMPGVYSKDDANFVPTKIKTLEGPKILGRIELKETPRSDSRKQNGAAGQAESADAKKKKRKRIKKTAAPVKESTVPADQKTKPGDRHKQHRDTRKPIEPKVELSEEEVQKQIRETLQRLSGSGKSKASKYRREKRQAISHQMEEEQARLEEEKRILKVTEFVTANDLASMMNVPVVQIIATCMSVGVFASINQRLDAETISLLADEFNYKVEFVSVEVQEAIDHEEVADNEEDLIPRPPIVTVMGHVDHGKTSLLDYIRKTNVIAGEAGGITQHIGAYEVKLPDGRKITFLDTPGHEAFTAMRARGAKVTDIVIIVIAADDTVMPQTIEAINHAQAAGSPMVFAINKIDKPGANPEKIKEELSKLNILVEDWGGKYQSQEISAKKGTNVYELLEKVLLEAELLELKGNPNRKALGTVIESSLDKGRGYVAKLLIQNGTLRIGDVLVAGSVYGKVKAMYNERNQVIKEAGPSSPVLLLGLTGAPQAGDTFNVMNDEREAKQIATKRQQLQREQGIRTQKHITLDEIGRRIAIGDFKELNLIVKGDVDGSVEALSDSMLKLSTEQVQVNVIHKSVGAITESDVLLASASNAIIIGFQVRPSMSARKLAEREEIDIRLYSIIYNALNELKAAIEGMLAPEIEEKITCNVEVREVFRITKVGTVAGCMVLDGKINRHTRVRIIRDGIVVYTGSLGSLKRFKDDVREVASGYECGLNIENYNDIRVGDIIEGFEEVEVKRKL